MAFAYNISSFTMFNFQIPNILKYIFFSLLILKHHYAKLDEME
jgi:hypothetical protein